MDAREDQNIMSSKCLTKNFHRLSVFFQRNKLHKVDKSMYKIYQ